MGHWSEMGSRSFSCLYRGTHRRCSIEKGVLKNFAKLTGKHLCQSLFFNEVADLGPATLLKNILLHSARVLLVLSCEFFEIFKSTLFKGHLRATGSLCNHIIAFNNSSYQDSATPR